MIQQDSSVQAVIRQVLEEESGCRTVVVGTAEGGLTEARSRPPDAVIVDARITDRPVGEFVEALRAHPETKALPVVLVTHNHETDALKYCSGLDICGVVAEPYDVPSVRRQLRKALGQVVPVLLRRDPSTKPRVLAFGLPPHLGTRLEAELNVTVQVRESEAELLQALQTNTWSLLLVVAGDLAGDCEALVGRVRREGGLQLPPILYGFESSSDEELPIRLVQELGVQTLIALPMDPVELTRQVARALNLSWTVSEIGTEAEALQDVGVSWEAFKLRATQRLEALEDAAAHLVEGALTPEMRGHALREAHKLAGSLRARRMDQGARLAGEAVRLLAPETTLFQPDILRLCELVVQLEQELRAAVRQTTSPKLSTSEEPSILVLTGNDDLKSSLQKGIDFRMVFEDLPSYLGNALTGVPPSIAVVDCSEDAHRERALLLLEEFAHHVPPVPVLALAEPESGPLRVEASRRGAKGVVSNRATPADILAAVTEILELVRASAPKVLVVDADPAFTQRVKHLLDLRGLRVRILHDSLRFWKDFHRDPPNLLILDVDLSHLNGIEVARMVRADPFWEPIPIIAFVSNGQGEDIRRVFAAGVDDYITKPVVGPELIARVTNRLERVHLQRQHSGIDPVTQVAGVGAAERMVRRLLQMAARQQVPVSLAVFDLDRLQDINGRFGIHSGDQVLRRLGQCLTQTLRPEDVIGRLGGDEFVVAMFGAKKMDAQVRVHSILRAFGREEFAGPEGELFRASASAGVSQFPIDGHDVPGLYEAAGRALTLAKGGGGNRVDAAGEAGQASIDADAHDVAIIDADQSIAGLLHLACTADGQHVRWFGTGEEALEKLAGAQPAVQARVIVLELDLPGVDGMTILRQLAEDGVLQRSRVVILSSRAAEEEVIATLELGAFDHIAKPFSLRVLMQRIRRALRG